MQTFLPLPTFEESAAVLDNNRCSNQVYEAKAILLHLTEGWYKRYARHPVMNMWRGYEPALATYMKVFKNECDKRKLNLGYDIDFFEIKNLVMPEWLGMPEFHECHRANLVRKKPDWYLQFGWKESGVIGYKWPKKIDGVWVLDSKEKQIVVPDKLFKKYLGREKLKLS